MRSACSSAFSRRARHPAPALGRSSRLESASRRTALRASLGFASLEGGAGIPRPRPSDDGGAERRRPKRPWSKWYGAGAFRERASTAFETRQRRKWAVGENRKSSARSFFSFDLPSVLPPESPRMFRWRFGHAPLPKFRFLGKLLFSITYISLARINSLRGRAKIKKRNFFFRGKFTPWELFKRPPSSSEMRLYYIDDRNNIAFGPAGRLRVIESRFAQTAY